MITIRIDMRLLQTLYILAAMAYYKWAMSEIPPHHPDVTKIMQRQRQLADQYQKLWR